ncbi:MAG TPA: caspase family protein, partial [Quisquiliibacterium sp.]|nr:caspase family protein [Quisquiliibacterium sp.]
MSLLLPAAWASTQRVALVVGNNAYAGLSPLVNAVADAELIASELQRAGFTVKLVRDANRRTLLREIREFSSRAEGGAEAVFYFAGHGIQVQSTNLLLPTDFQGRDDAEAHDEAVSLTWISNSLREAKARFSLLIIDACRNNPLPRSNGRTVGAERGLAPVSPAVGQMVIFSAGTGQEALDKLGRNDTNRNGLFVREFVRQMRRAGVPIDQMLRDVRDEVERQAASVKHAQRPALYDESKGQFYFFAAVPVAAATVAAAPATGAPVVPPATSIVAAGAPAAKTREQIEDELWASLSDSESVEVFEAYLAEYPNGRYAAPARIRIAQLRRSQAPRAAAPAVASAATAAAAAAPATTAAVRVPPAAAVAPAAPVAAAAPAAAVAPAPSVAPATPATPAAPATPVTAVAPVAKAAPSAPAPAAAGGPSPAPIALARPVV